MKKNKKCNKKISVRIGSWFENHKLTLDKICLITYFLVFKVREIFVRYEHEIAGHTVVDLYNFLEKCERMFWQKNSENLGVLEKHLKFIEVNLVNRNFVEDKRE